MSTTGILLINLGTPQSPQVSDVKSYLKEFLMDARVITLPSFIRFILVYGLIAPFRSKKTARNYQEIWTINGSPLLTHTQQLAEKLQNNLSAQYQVEFGMRYGQPSIEAAIDKLKHLKKIIVLPLYPQYASATTGSSIVKVMAVFQKQQFIPNLEFISDFYNHPAYIQALTASIKKHYKRTHHLIFSFHGLPELQLKALGCKPVCQTPCSSNIEVQGCYRQQCFISATTIAKNLEIQEHNYSVCFQSRLGKTPWIKPYTDDTLAELAKQGVKKIQIACPSFVADCLETLEEISISAKKMWAELGGEEFEYIPCLNSEQAWIAAVKNILTTTTAV